MLVKFLDPNAEYEEYKILPNFYLAKVIPDGKNGIYLAFDEKNSLNKINEKCFEEKNLVKPIEIKKFKIYFNMFSNHAAYYFVSDPTRRERLEKNVKNHLQHKIVIVKINKTDNLLSIPIEIYNIKITDELKFEIIENFQDVIKEKLYLEIKYF